MTDHAPELVRCRGVVDGRECRQLLARRDHNGLTIIAPDCVIESDGRARVTCPACGHRHRLRPRPRQAA